jgi:hypothetical protein
LVIVIVGVPTSDPPNNSAEPGTVIVIVSGAEMTYPASASSVIVTTVSEVLTTSVTEILSLTSTFQPWASAPAEVMPLIIFCLCPSNNPPAATIQVSLVKVRIIVLPPATTFDSKGAFKSVPVTATEEAVEADAEGEREALGDSEAEDEEDGLVRPN